jgi:hypothetical protein
MYLAVKDVKPLENYYLLLKFENNEERVFDVKPYLEIGKFQELKDENLFKSVKVCFDSIEWANQLDLDPELLYENHTTKQRS